MVEFALLSPLFLLLVFGIVVGGMMINAQVQLSNAVRDGVRAAAVCGDSNTNSLYVTVPTISLPGGASCSDASVKSYISGLLGNIPGGGKVTTTTYSIYSSDNTYKSSSLSDCAKGYKVELAVAYSQPLYLPLIDHFFGDNGGTSRTLKADAQATCEN